jgi:hypothetical protein
VSCGDYHECTCSEASCATRRYRVGLPHARALEPWWVEAGAFWMRAFALGVTLYWVWWLL